MVPLCGQIITHSIYKPHTGKIHEAEMWDLFNNYKYSTYANIIISSGVRFKNKQDVNMFFHPLVS